MVSCSNQISVLVEAEAKRKAITEFRTSLHIFKLCLHVSYRLVVFPSHIPLNRYHHAVWSNISDGYQTFTGMRPSCLLSKFNSFKTFHVGAGRPPFFCVPPDVVPSIKGMFLITEFVSNMFFVHGNFVSKGVICFPQVQNTCLYHPLTMEPMGPHHLFTDSPCPGGGISIPRPWRKSETMHAPGRRDEVWFGGSCIFRYIYTYTQYIYFKTVVH